MSLFCPNCYNILNISKKSQSKIITNEEPSSVSSDSPINIIDKIINNDKLSNEEIKSIDRKTIQSSEEYTQLDKKKRTVLNKKITELIKSGNVDDSLKAFYICKNCGFSQEIPNGTLITSKANPGNITNIRVDTEKFKNLIYSKILPHTRAYICPNEKCASHKDHSLREAVFYRPSNSLQTWYTCSACQNYWIGN
jgi:DNA-directed RNA polymerase subunit M/transcription elongation factor TFIIS